MIKHKITMIFNYQNSSNGTDTSTLLSTDLSPYSTSKPLLIVVKTEVFKGLRVVATAHKMKCLTENFIFCAVCYKRGVLGSLLADCCQSLPFC